MMLCVVVSGWALGVALVVMFAHGASRHPD